MRKGLIFAVFMLVLLMGLTMVRAVEDNTPEPGTPADNECYPGGELYREENQDGCPTLWYWKAGWYLARFKRGLISRADFPKEFESVLPPLEDAYSNCWNANYGVSIRYIGPANTMGNILAFNGSGCTGPNNPLPKGTAFVAFADNQTDANVLCSVPGRISTAYHLNTIGWYDAPSNAYGCSVSSGGA